MSQCSFGGAVKSAGEEADLTRATLSIGQPVKFDPPEHAYPPTSIQAQKAGKRGTVRRALSDSYADVLFTDGDVVLCNEAYLQRIQL